MSYESSEFSISAGIGAIKRMTPVVLVLALQVVRRITCLRWCRKDGRYSSRVC